MILFIFYFLTFSNTCLNCGAKILWNWPIILEPHFKPMYQNEFGTIKLKNVGSNDFRLQHNIILNFSLFLFFKINIICLPYWTFINRIHFTSYWAIVGFGKLLGIWKCSSNPKKRLEYYCHKLRETRLMRLFASKLHNEWQILQTQGRRKVWKFGCASSN